MNESVQLLPQRAHEYSILEETTLRREADLSRVPYLVPLFSRSLAKIRRRVSSDNARALLSGSFPADSSSECSRLLLVRNNAAQCRAVCPRYLSSRLTM